MSRLADFENKEDFTYLCLAIICIFCAALAAGLTIGLVSMDKNALRLLLINGSEEEKRQVRKVLPLVRDRHWLLVTLFLFNATANEALPVFLEKIVPGYAAIVASALLVLVFGEIIPSSVFGGRRQLELAAKLSWIVQILFVVLFIVAKPIALFLDYWIGTHDVDSVPFNARDLYTLLSLSASSTHPKDTTSEVPPSYIPPNPTPSLSSLRGKPKAYNRLDGSDHSQSVVLHFETEMTASTKSDPSTTSVMHLLHDAEVGEAITINASLERKSSMPTGKHHASNTAAQDSSQLDHHKAPAFLANADGERLLLNRNSVTIAQGAIVCSRKTVISIMVPPEAYFSIHAHDEVTIDLFEQLGACGYSRVIVYEGSEALGYVVVKEMLSHVRRFLLGGPDGKKQCGHVTDLPMHPLEYFDVNVSVLDALGRLKGGASRIAAVTTDGFSRSGVMGFFSLEDVMEAIIQEEIEDEKDFAKFYVARRATTSDALGGNVSVIGTTVGLF